MDLAQVLLRIYVRGKRGALATLPMAEFIYPDRPLGARIPDYTNEPLLPGLVQLVAGGCSPALAHAAAVAGEDLRQKRFRFVGEESVYDGSIDWGDRKRSRLWRLNLHYFNESPLWVLDAVVNNNRGSYDRWTVLMGSWMKDNPAGRLEAWNPYCVSLRIPSLIAAYQLAVLADLRDRDFEERLLRSLYRQATYLYGNVEWDLPMNHQTANGRALLQAGIFFKGGRSEAWRRRGLSLIWKRLQRDVCRDGGQAERSPMYHLLVLQDSLESYVLSQRFGIEWPAPYVEVLRNMVRFADAVEHPDGDIALFNDSAIGIAVKSQELRLLATKLLFGGGEPHAGNRYESFFCSALDPDRKLFSASAEKVATGPHLREFPETGYYVIEGRSPGRKVILDCGEVGIMNVASHAHSDLLSYELSVAGERVVVDSGTSTYAFGPRRQYERAIIAHNAVSVDGKDTCEPWSDYRLARRGHPGRVRTLEEHGVVIIDAGHKGFLGMRGIIHRRAIISIEEHLIVFDRILGPGAHSAEARVLLHPGIRVHPLDPDGVSFMAAGKVAKLLIRCFGARVSLEVASDDRLTGWYAERFGELLPTTHLRMSSQGWLPLFLGHVISTGDSTVQCSASGDEWRMALQNRESRVDVVLGAQGLRTGGSTNVAYAWL